MGEDRERPDLMRGREDTQGRRRVGDDGGAIGGEPPLHDPKGTIEPKGSACHPRALQRPRR